MYTNGSMFWPDRYVLVQWLVGSAGRIGSTIRPTKLMHKNIK